MRMKVIEINFASNLPWLFRLIDSTGVEYFVLNAEKYAEFGVASPVTRLMLDNFDIGTSIQASSKEWNGANIVTVIAR